MSPIGLQRPSFSIGMYLDLAVEKFVVAAACTFSVLGVVAGWGDIASVLNPILSIRSVGCVKAC